MVKRFAWIAGTLCLLAGASVYLREPPWTADAASGFRGWEEDPPGTRFRWMTGRASFFVPASAGWMILPLRAVFPGPARGPVVVRVSVDDRWLADIQLTDPDAWVRARIPLPRRSSSRRYRRIDLHVNRVVGPFLLGVETGVVGFDNN
jgi:hypothetical protein